MEKLIIVGTSTTGKHVYEFIKYHNLYDIIGFAVNAKYKTRDTFCNLPVYELENLNRECHGIRFKVFIAMLWNKLNKERKEVYQFCIKNNYQLMQKIFFTIVKSKTKILLFFVSAKCFMVFFFNFFITNMCINLS